MPNYEYLCTSCSAKYMFFQGFDEGPIKYCTSCKTDSLRKVYTVPGISFKGTGWAGKQ